MTPPRQIECPFCGDFRTLEEDGYSVCRCRMDWLCEARRIVAGETEPELDDYRMALFAAMKRVDELEAKVG
jgi:hypothetical protein